jgi:hypothetical protein
MMDCYGQDFSMFRLEFQLPVGTATDWRLGFGSWFLVFGSWF